MMSVAGNLDVNRMEGAGVEAVPMEISNRCRHSVVDIGIIALDKESKGSCGSRSSSGFRTTCLRSLR
jgi:hypothetical protein